MGALGRLLYPGGGGKVTCYHRLQPACGVVVVYSRTAHCRHSARSNCSVCLLQLMLLLMHVAAARFGQQRNLRGSIGTGRG